MENIEINLAPNGGVFNAITECISIANSTDQTVTLNANGIELIIFSFSKVSNIYEIYKLKKELETLEESTLPNAIKTLQEYLKVDDDYRQSWVANIAMAMYDEFIGSGWDVSGENNDDKDNTLHAICNRGAERFINQFIK